MSRTSSFTLLSGCVAVLFLTGQNCEPEPLRWENEELRFRNVTLDRYHDGAREMITIGWAYDNEDLLSAQTMTRYNLVIRGLQFDEVDLNISDRGVTFPFTVPLTVQLTAYEEKDIADIVAFDIRADESYYFTAEISCPYGSDPNYPRLGWNNRDRANRIQFSQFVAFFDPPENENGAIDELVTALLPSDTVFRALTSDVYEHCCDEFGMGYFPSKQGSAYPCTDPWCLYQTRSNVIIFGGAIAYDGEIIDVKGAGQGRRGTGMTFEPIFMAITLRIGWLAEVEDITEVQLGNLNQGLILPLFAGQEPWYCTRDILEYDCSDWQISGDIVGGQIYNSGPGYIRGFIKSGLVGLPITPLTYGGNVIDACAVLETVEWDMPLARDDDLLGRLTF